MQRTNIITQVYAMLSRCRNTYTHTKAKEENIPKSMIKATAYVVK
jgi:hypothetical protein